MKYTTEQILELLAADEEKHPSGKSPEDVADLHCSLADMVGTGIIEMAIQDGRPMFKAALPPVKIKIDLTSTPEMLN